MLSSTSLATIEVHSMLSVLHSLGHFLLFSGHLADEEQGGETCTSGRVDIESIFQVTFGSASVE